MTCIASGVYCDQCEVKLRDEECLRKHIHCVYHVQPHLVSVAVHLGGGELYQVQQTKADTQAPWQERVGDKSFIPGASGTTCSGHPPCSSYQGEEKEKEEKDQTSSCGSF